MNTNGSVSQAYKLIIDASDGVKKLAKTTPGSLKASQLSGDVFECIKRTEDSSGSLFGIWEKLASDFEERTHSFLATLKRNHPNVYLAIKADEMIKAFDIKPKLLDATLNTSAGLIERCDNTLRHSAGKDTHNVWGNLLARDFGRNITGPIAANKMDVIFSESCHAYAELFSRDETTPENVKSVLMRTMGTDAMSKLKNAAGTNKGANSLYQAIVDKLK